MGALESRAQDVAQVGQLAPPFAMQCTWAGGKRAETARLEDYRGSWLLLIFYPRDFTFVCPAELISFSSRFAEFRNRDCRLLGISVDPLEVHQEWLSLPRPRGGLGPLRYPLASDPEGAAARAYGVWNAEREVATRGLFLVDPEGVLQYAVTHNLSVGRNPDEVLRVLDALRDGGLCPPSWTLGDGTIDPLQELGPGRVLGHYQVMEQLGEGGFARVYLAHDRRLDRSVALKVIKPGVAVDVPRILAEARVASAVNDPHVCTIHAVDEDAGLPFLVLEYCGGTSLATVLRLRRLEIPEIRTIAAQIAAGLAAAHEQGVVHGDLKPSNIAIGEGGRAKILDFGIGSIQYVIRPHRSGQPAGGRGDEVSTIPLALDRADDRARPADPRPQQPRNHQVVVRGTPAYMAPEQLEGRRTSPATDVYVFGLVLAEMATGERAVKTGPVPETLERARTLDLPALVGKVPEPFRAVAARALVRDPRDRPTIDELRAMILDVPDG